MKRMKNFAKLILISSILAAMSQLTSAQPGPRYGWQDDERPAYGRFDGRGQGWRGVEGKRQMWVPDLTEEQKEEIKELRLAHLKDVQPLKSELKVNRAKLQALMVADDPDMSEINTLIEENGNTKTELQKKAVAHRLEVRDLLTDEQKVFLDARRGKGRAKLHAYKNRNRRF